MRKKFTVGTRYDSFDGYDYTVVIDEDGKDTDYDLDDLRNKYGEKSIEIIVRTK